VLPVAFVGALAPRQNARPLLSSTDFDPRTGDLIILSADWYGDGRDQWRV
jgi:hypothetical protein